MTSIIATLRKVAWEDIAYNVIVVVVISAIVNAIVHGVAERNGAIWLGVLALVGSLFWGIITKDDNHDWWSYAPLCVTTALVLFFVTSPFLHLRTKNRVFEVDKVWMVDGKTTMSHNVLWRSPFSKFATSINGKQDVSLTVSGRTKDGTAVVAILSGAFSISDDEKVVIKHFSKMRDPNAETADMLKKALQMAFEQTIGTMTVTDIVTSKNNFAIERVIASTTVIDSLGLVGSGSLAVSDLHPYFGSK